MNSPTAVSVSISEPKAELSLNSALAVVSLVPGGAAERAGVRVGDTLLTVGGAAQQQGDSGMLAALAAIKSAPRPVGLVFSRGGGGGGVPSQLAQLVLRLFAGFVLGISIFNLVSGGFAFISSALVIAQAACLLNLSRSVEALALAFGGMLSGEGDCGGDGCCSSVGSLRALSIAGMVFSIIEILAIFPVTEAFGVVQSYNSGTYINNGYSFYCQSSFQYCYSSQGYISYSNYYSSLAIYLLYAASHTLLSAVLHLALSVTMFRLVRLFKSSQQRAEGGGDRQPLVGAASLADAYVTMGSSVLPAPSAIMPSLAYNSSPSSYMAPNAGYN
jgi:hypothetical protein